MSRPAGLGRFRTGGRRVALGLLDAGVSSIGNLAVTVFAARTMSVSDFGVLTTAMMALIVLAGLFKSAHGDVLVLTSASSSDERKARRSQESLDSAVALSVLMAGIGLLVGLAWALVDGGSFGRASTTILAAAVVAPFLLVQDHYRWIEYTRGRVDLALTNNALWTTTAFALVAIAYVLGSTDPSPALVLLLWGGGTIPAIVFGRMHTGASLRLRRRTTWVRENRALVGTLLQDYGLLQASSQGAVLLLAGLSPPSDIGLLRKAQIFLAPVTVAMNGLNSVLQPLLVARYARSGHRGVVSVSMPIAVAAIAAVAAYGALVLSLPAPAAGMLVGEGWSEARTFLPPLLVHVCAGIVGGCAGLSLRAVGLVTLQVRVRWVIAPLSVLALAVATMSGGAIAGIWALAAAGLLATTIWTGLLFRRAQDRTGVPGGSLRPSEVMQ
jgi:O-antigen/teichoic acid export membrane protein